MNRWKFQAADGVLLGLSQAQFYYIGLVTIAIAMNVKLAAAVE